MNKKNTETFMRLGLQSFRSARNDVNTKANSHLFTFINNKL